MFRDLPLSPEAHDRLSADFLRHIVTLKVHHLYPDAVKWDYAQDGNSWALVSLVAADASHYDRAAYPSARFVVLVDGDSVELTWQLVKSLPKDNFVAKVCDAEKGRLFEEHFGAVRTVSFESYTAEEAKHSTSTTASVVEQSTSPSQQLIDFYIRSGYSAEEMETRISQGCNWYWIRENDHIACTCMTFQNYGVVWEIGGVYTDPAYRRRGLARAVVTAALQKVVADGRIPRYQFNSSNAASRNLAQQCGLHWFLRVDHYVAAAI